MKNFLPIAFIFIISITSVQSSNFDFDSHKEYIKQITNSNIVTYKSVIEKFDAHINQNPEDLISIIEKCNFIEAYTYAESEMLYFDFISQDFDDCESQINLFPEDLPQRILYNISSTWNERSVEIYNETKEKGIDNWSLKEKTRLYLIMDETTMWKKPRNYQYAYQGFEETHDTRFVLGAAQYQLDNKVASIELIKNFTPRNQDEKTELMELFLKLGMINKASEIFESITSKDDIQKDLLFKLNVSLDSQYQPSNDELDLIQKMWNFEEKFQEVYQYAIDQKKFTVAHSIYQYRSSNDFWFDPFGHTKFNLYKQSSTWNWNINDIYSVLMWLAVVFGSVLVMFIVIAPIHYRGLYRRVHNKPLLVSITQWNLKHALFLGSMFILIDIVLSIIFQYQSIFTMFFLDTEVELDTTSGLPSKMYFYYSFFIFGFGLLILKPGKDLFKTKASDLLKSIFVALGVFIVLKIILIASVFFYKLSVLTAEINFTHQTILDLKNSYGTLTVYLSIALLTPLIEEYLFRGVLLNSFTKHISFGWANTIQATLFALIHENTQLFLYYFTFGLIAGIFVKKQKHLYGAIALHVINNALAVAALTF